MQILTQQLTRRVQQEAAKVPEKDMAGLLREESGNIQGIFALERVYIPRLKQEPPPSAN